MTKPILACDVDLCVVRSDLGWMDYLNKLSDTYQYNLREDNYRNSWKRFNYIDLSDSPEITYNFCDLFPDIPVETALDYWRQRDLYSYLSPIRGSEKGIQRLSEYYDIVFVSHIKGDHHKDKVKFLKNYFPSMSGFLATKEKRFAACSVIIDDRLDNLNSMPDNLIRVQYKTKYTQKEYPKEGTKVMNDWSKSEVDKIINYLEEIK